MDRQDDNSDDKAATSAAPPAWKRFLSHDSGPFAQFVKYGAIGVASTLVQMLVFYCLASTICRCLGPEDWAVKWFGLPAVEISRFVRGLRFAIDTVIGFSVANVFCWLMNRAFVFRPGKFAWYKEFGMFFGAAACAMGIATGLSWMLIHWVGLQTSVAVIIEVIVSFLVNFVVRKFFIFKG